MTMRLDPAAPPGLACTHILLSQIVRAAETLAAERDPHRALHGARKRIKKIRALLALFRSIDRGFVRGEDRRWRDTARLLAGPREAAALVETMDRFIEEFPEANRQGELTAIRAVFEHRRDGIADSVEQLEPAMGAAILSCVAGGEAVAEWRLPADPEEMARHLAAGVKRNWQEIDKALGLAQRRDRQDDFHELRKAVKRHLAQLQFLREFWPGGAADRLARCEALAERLGEINDIHVMQDALSAEPQGFGEEPNVPFFTELLAEKRRQLALDALDEADRLFADRPRKLSRRFRTKMQSDRWIDAPLPADAD